MEWVGCVFVWHKTGLLIDIVAGFATVGLGVLAGGPGGGGILGTSGSGAALADEQLNWNGTWIYAGVTVLGASAIFAAVRVMRGGTKILVKV